MTGGKACESACPAATPFHSAQLFAGQTVDCEDSCPTFHNAADECISVCPEDAPLHQPDGLCVSVCPTTAPFHLAMETTCLTSCPPATPFHNFNGTCTASCPFGVNSDNSCVDQGPD